jgi:hypothetical protein
MLKKYILLLTITHLLFGCSPADSTQSIPDNKVKHLSTLDAVAQDLLTTMPDEQREQLRAMPKHKLITLIRSIGNNIQEKYGLVEANDALIINACQRMCSPDEASMKIIEATWAKLQE